MVDRAVTSEKSARRAIALARARRSSYSRVNRMRARLLTLLLVPSVLACANHVRTVEHEQEHERVSVVEVQYEFDSPEDVVRAPRIHIELSVEETLETRAEKTIITIEESTPYSPARELYEVPLGLVSLPFAFVAQVGDALMLGALPDRVVDGFSNWTVSALNPALNTESETRVEGIETDRQLRQGTPVRTVVRRPLAHYPVEVLLEGGAPVVVHTDRGGHAVAHVLQLAAAGLPAPPRKLQIRVPETDLERTLLMDRRLTSRVWQARIWLEVLGRSDPEPDELSEAISAIDQLGFPRYSLEAEDTVHARFADDRGFLLTFRRAMDRAVPSAAPPVSSARN